MNSDHRDLISHLFTEALARLEDATIDAMRGQSRRLQRAAYLKLARRLADAAAEIEALARAATAIAQKPAGSSHPARQKRRA